MAMTKKDFEAIADALRAARSDAISAGFTDIDGVLDIVLARMLPALRVGNPRFDAGRFRQWVMSVCLNCGGPVKEDSEQFCGRCRKLSKKELEHGR